MRWFARLLLPLLHRLPPVLMRLRSWQLLALVTAVTLLSWLIPDPIPFVDEILLTIILILLTRWRTRRKEPFEGQSAPPPAQPVQSKGARE